MFLAPPLPQEKRRGKVARTLFGLGFSGAALVLIVLNLLLLVATYFYVTPPELYNRAWEMTPQYIYDPGKLEDWQAWKNKFDGKIETDEDAVKYANEMLDSLNDPFTRLLSSEEVMQMMERQQGNFSGVGIVLGVEQDSAGQPVNAADGNPLPDVDENGHPVINRVMPGGPAKASGVQTGDAITSVDGKSTKGLSLEQLIDEIRGPTGQPVTFGIDRDGQSLSITVVRAQVEVPAVTTKILPGNIGYIRLEGFDQFDATEEMIAGLKELKDTDALVFDLRNNPGGLVSNALSISSLFLEQGTVVSIRSRIPGKGYETQTVRLTSQEMIVTTERTGSSRVKKEVAERVPNMSGDRPIVVLVNSHSASASEMTTGALKDNDRVTVVGTRTFGKGIGQTYIPMPNGTVLAVTTLRYFTPNGTWLGDGNEKHGIEPHVVVEPNDNIEFGAEGDNQLATAMQLLEQKLSGK